MNPALSRALSAASHAAKSVSLPCAIALLCALLPAGVLAQAPAPKQGQETAAPALEVVSRTPLGATASKTAALAITAAFNQPAARLGPAEEMATFCPLEIEPKVKGRCRWLGTQAVSFEPDKPLPAATAFKVRLKAGTASQVTGARLAKDEVWEFETLRPNLGDSRPSDGDKWIDPNGVILLQFTQEMDPGRARQYITLEEFTRLSPAEQRVVPLGVRRATPEEIKSTWPYRWDEPNFSTAVVLALKPSRLAPDKAYAVKLRAGLPGAEGALGLPSDRVVNFETWYPFRAIEPPASRCLPGEFSLALSNPASYKDFVASLSVEPSTPIPAPEGYLAEGSGQRDPDNRRVHFDLPDIGWQPDTLYRFTLSGKLKDVFGNALGEDFRFSLRTGSYCPMLNMPANFGILESYLPLRHPVNSVNVAEAPLRTTRVADEGFIPFYKGINWGCQTPHDAPMTNATTLRLGGPLDARQRGFVDLGPVVAPAKGGSVFIQLLSPNPSRSTTPCWIKALDNATRLGLDVKTSRDSTLVWAAFLKTGSPAPGVPVELRDDANKVLWRGQTDKSGFADAPGWLKLGITDWKRWERPNVWAFARDSGGTAVMSTGLREGPRPWQFNISYDWYPRPEQYRGALFTERGVYRPGETVRIKGLVRRLEQGDWVGLDGRRDPAALRVTLTDPRGTDAAVSTVSLSEFSSFHFSHLLSEEAPTGVWRVSVEEASPRTPRPLVRPAGAPEVEREGDGEGDGDAGAEEGAEEPEPKIYLSEDFRVEAFKPASFEVRVVPEKDTFLAGDAYRAAVDGWYLFGAPMAEAPFSWSLRLEPASYAPPGHEGFTFESPWWTAPAPAGSLLGAGSGKLDDKGKAAIEAKLVTGEAKGPMTALLEASVTSPERQRLFGRRSALVHRAGVYLGVKASTGFVEKGKPFKADVITVRPDGSPVQGIAVSGRLIRRDWLSVQRAGVAGRLEWQSERRDTTVATFSFVSAGTFTWTHVPAEPGEHLLSVSAVDEWNRPAETQDGFYVTGSGAAWWERTDTDVVELVADRKSYRPGDTARILVKSPFKSCRALVTVEREGILARWTTLLEGGANVVLVPLNDKSVPNVYVSVVLVQGRGADAFDSQGLDLGKPQAKFGYVNLPVDPGGRRLSVKVATDRREYRPGQKVTVDLRVADGDGRGAPAELTVFAVDEGVLALTGYATPDVFAAFYGPRPLQVATADSRLHVIGQRSFGEKGRNRGGGGSSGAQLEGVDLRSRFVPTAFWDPSVRTSVQGTATLSFTLPDNLSRFRVMAVAHSGKRMGSAESSLTVSKPLLLRPSLPRLARVGDAFKAGVVVHNYSQAPSNVVLDMTLVGDAVAADGAARREVTVGAGKAVEVLWDCRAAKPGSAVFRFRSAAGPEKDGLEWTVPVRQAERLERAATSGATQAQAVEEVAFPGNISAGAQLWASFSPSALSGLQEGARFLLEYPYGCLEQKLSRILPVIAGAELVEAFGLGTVGSLRAETQKVLDRLKDFQHPSGGFGYWPNPWLPDPYLTAYALETAHLAGKERYALPREVLDKALAWLQGYVAEQKAWAYPYTEAENYAARAYAVYSLSLHGRKLPGPFQELYQRRDQLPFLAKAYLLKAAPGLTSAPEPAKTLAAELLNQARRSPRSLHFEEPVETRMDWIPDSTVRATAGLLQALLEAQGGFPGDELAVRWLMEERKARGRWRTTHENAQTLRALQDFYRRYEKEAPSFAADLSVERGGRWDTLWNAAFQGRTLLTRSKPLDPAAILDASSKARLRFSKQGQGRLYYTLAMGYAPAGYDAPASEGFQVSKEVRPLTGPKSGALRAGTRAVVTITVRTPQDRTFVALEDPLPAGWEIVDPTFAVEGAEDARALADEGERGRYWGTFHRNEKYDDRIVVFADMLAAGEHRYSYLVQATTPGRFHAPAAWVEQMYQPEVFGRTKSGEVEVNP